MHSQSDSPFLQSNPFNFIVSIRSPTFFPPKSDRQVIREDLVAAGRKVRHHCRDHCQSFLRHPRPRRLPNQLSAWPLSLHLCVSRIINTQYFTISLFLLVSKVFSPSAIVQRKNATQDGM